MNNQEKIVKILAERNLCDDCLSIASAVEPRQTVNAICNGLKTIGQITRRSEECPRCLGIKLVNRVARDATAATAAATEEHVRPPAPVVLSEPPPAARPWYWEGHVQERIAAYLVSEGFRLNRLAGTLLREPGKDIDAQSRSGKRLWVTVKGYPEKSGPVQARHWFAECLFDLILYHSQDKEVDLAIGLLADYTTYRNLAARVTWFKESLGFRFYWVAKDGTVQVE